MGSMSRPWPSSATEVPLHMRTLPARVANRLRFYPLYRVAMALTPRQRWRAPHTGVVVGSH